MVTPEAKTGLIRELQADSAEMRGRRNTHDVCSSAPAAPSLDSSNSKRGLLRQKLSRALRAQGCSPGPMGIAKIADGMVTAPRVHPGWIPPLDKHAAGRESRMPHADVMRGGLRLRRAFRISAPSALECTGDKAHQLTFQGRARWPLSHYHKHPPNARYRSRGSPFHLRTVAAP